MSSMNYPMQPPKLPQLDEIHPIVDRAMERHISVRDALEKNIEIGNATVANVLEPIIHDEDVQDMEVEVFSILMYASPDKDARTTAEAAIKRLGTLSTQDLSRKKLFSLLQAVKEKGENIDAEYAKYLDKLLDEYRQAGHGVLSDEKIKEYSESATHITNLCHEFSRIQSEDESGIWISHSELDGVPQSELDNFQQRSGDGEKEYFIPNTDAGRPITKYGLNPAMRKKAWLADAQCLEKNAKLFREIILKRDTRARALGFSSHADSRMSDRVAKDTKWVETLLSQLKETLMPLARAEMDAMVEQKRAHLKSSKYTDEHGDNFMPWDYAFYSRLGQEKLGVDHAVLSEYFPLRHTVAAMMGLFSRMLGLRFEKLSDEQIKETTWHEDVEGWEAWDVKDDGELEFVGYVFLDLLFRPGKYRGGQDDNMRPSFVRKDGGRVYPSTCLMCCFPRPADSSCVLLRHSEVVVVFHELGHGMHDIIARTKTAKFHGWRSPPEYSETPSMMLENWCWMKDVVREMSCHYSSLSDEYAADWRGKNPGKELPAKKLPEKQLDALLASRRYNVGLRGMLLLSTAVFDLTVYNQPSHEALQSLDITKLWGDIRSEHVLFTRPGAEAYSYGYAHMRHMVLGMDVGFYGYLAAQVFAANIFQHTFKNDPFDPIAWKNYRTGILEHGASKDELDLLTTYLGHEPKVQLYLDHLRSMAEPDTEKKN